MTNATTFELPAVPLPNKNPQEASANKLSVPILNRSKGDSSRHLRPLATNAHPTRAGGQSSVTTIVHLERVGWHAVKRRSLRV